MATSLEKPLSRAGARWTEGERKELARCMPDGLLYAEDAHRLADRFQRSVESIYSKAQEVRMTVAAEGLQPNAIVLSLTTGRDSRAPVYAQPKPDGLTGTRVSLKHSERVAKMRAITPPPLQEGPAIPLAHEALETGSYVPFWERDAFAQREQRDRLVYKDDPNYATRLAKARERVAEARIRKPDGTPLTKKDMMQAQLRLARRAEQGAV